MKCIIEVDVILLSFARTVQNKLTTENCIRSLLNSENANNIKFNIIVIESALRLGHFQYENTITVYPREEFSYNKFFNIGIQETEGKYICLCHSDLLFKPLWATEILKAFNRYYDLSSASPVCSMHHPKMGFDLNSGLYFGNRSSYELAGWCIFLKRDIFRIIGKLDENYKVWCADNDYGNILSVLRLRHALVTSAVVDHLDNDILFDQGEEYYNEKFITHDFFYYEKKWAHRTYGLIWQEFPIATPYPLNRE